MITRVTIQEILADQWETMSEQTLIKRRFSWADELNYCLTGIRRAGKSYMLMQRIRDLLDKGIPRDAILYVNFEDERLLEITAGDLNKFIEVQAETAPQHRVSYVFLDELQNVAGWEKFVRRLADSKYHVYVTGSNAKMLSREIATTLGGRFMIEEVYPYSFAEYLKASGMKPDLSQGLTTKGRAAMFQAFHSYLMEGAFPELIGLKAKKLYLNTIYQTIYVGDIIARNGITNEFALRLLLKKLAESVCRPISYSRLANIVKGSGAAIAKSTVIKYISYMQDSYLIFPIYNYQGKLLDKEMTPKYYFMDTGLLNLLTLDGATASLENLAAIDLVRRFGQEEVYYYEKNIEMDFFVPKRRMAMQVCYALHQSEETFRREVEGLLKFNAHIPGQDLYILTVGEEETIERDGAVIHVVPMWKWLLREEPCII